MRPTIFDLQQNSMNKKGGFRATIYDKSVAKKQPSVDESVEQVLTDLLLCTLTG